MRITVENFRGCRNATIDVTSIALVCGLNESGKTSLLEAAAAALTGTAKMHDMTAAQIPLLLTDHAEEGSVLLESETGTAHVRLPSGRCTAKGTPPTASDIATGRVRITDLEPRARAKLVSDIIKAEPSTDTLHPEVAKVINQVGWDGAYAEFKDRLARTKGAWEAATGERYGSAKSAEWAPQGFTPMQLAGLSESNLSEQIEVLNKRLLNVTVRAAMSDAERVALKRQAISLPNLQAALAAARERLVAAKTARQAMPPDPAQTALCPHCKAPVLVVSRQVLQKPGPVLSEDELKKLRAERASQEGMIAREQDEVWRLERECQASEAAQAKLAELEQATAPAGESVNVEAVQGQIAQLDAQRKALKAFTDAAAAHKRITGLQKVVDALAPEGLRAEALVGALGKFNAHAREVCDAAAWPAVALTRELNITYGGRSYRWCSKSAQWRADAVIQLVVTKCYEGTNVVLLDECDILDGPGRNGLLRMLSKSGLAALVAMTLRKREEMPDITKIGGRSYWLEAGVVG